MWKHVRERFQVVKVRVLHPKIPERNSVDILRGVSKSSRLSPTLLGILVSGLIHELKTQFPNATITQNGGLRWIGGILYVDDLCLISTDAHELQMMITNAHELQMTIPPLYITQNMQLAQLRFKLFSAPPATIQHFV